MTATGRRSTRSRCSRTDSSDAACCSISPASAGCRGSSPASTSSPRTWRRPSASRGCACGRGRHPADAHRPRAAGWPSWGPGTRPSTRPGLHPTAMEFMAGAGVAVLGSDGNNDTAPSSTEGVDFPDPRARDHRDGDPPARLPAVRGSAARPASARAAGSSCSWPRRCGSWADRLAPQPGGRVLTPARVRARAPAAAPARKNLSACARAKTGVRGGRSSCRSCTAAGCSALRYLRARAPSCRW